MTLKAVIADDESVARSKIRRFLESEGDVEVVAECEDGRQAIAAVRQERPDLLFLDIEMPGKDGFDVVRAIHASDDRPPAVVFVTAHQEHAVKAFEVHAVDYLLKPFDRRRFETALEAARGKVVRGENGELSRRLLDLLEGMKAKPKHADRLTVRKAGRIFFLDVDDIRWVDAAGNYVKLNTADGSYLLRETMTNLEKKLDPSTFLRIHRSTIVNVEEIKEIQPLFHGEYAILLEGGHRLTLSRTYRYQLDKLLG